MKTLIAAIALTLTSTAALADRYDDRYYDTRYNTSTETRYYDTRYEQGCSRCGVVLDINRYRNGNGNGHASGGGAVLGALIGGALGNQVGSGNGKKAATVAGAVAGGVAGHNIEKNRHGNGHNDRYEILVRMDDGRRVVVDQNDLNGVREGSRVYVRNGTARLR